MNTAARAKRILAAMAEYHSESDLSNWPPHLISEDLGDPIGWYGNNDTPSDAIGIFSDGLTWNEGERRISVRYSDIAQVDIPNGKQSDLLSVKKANNEAVHLRITGRREKFFDSMEFVRFLDRVRSDRAKK